MVWILLKFTNDLYAIYFITHFLLLLSRVLLWLYRRRKRLVLSMSSQPEAKYILNAYCWKYSRRWDAKHIHGKRIVLCMCSRCFISIPWCLQAYTTYRTHHIVNGSLMPPLVFIFKAAKTYTSFFILFALHIFYTALDLLYVIFNHTLNNNKNIAMNEKQRQHHKLYIFFET